MTRPLYTVYGVLVKVPRSTGSTKYWKVLESTGKVPEKYRGPAVQISNFADDELVKHLQAIAYNLRVMV